VKKIVFLIVCLSFLLVTFSQEKKYHIIGSFVNTTSSKKITIGNQTVPIVNNKFDISGSVDKEEFSFMNTENSYMWGIWLATGEYKIEVEEWEQPKKKREKFLLRMPKIEGPETALKFVTFQKFEEDLNKKAYNNLLAKDSINYYYTQHLWEYIKLQKKSDLIEELLTRLTKDKYSAELLQKVDSLNGDKEYSKVSAGMQLLTKGNKLENFTQPTSDGKPFSLYNVKGKYILLDFWASWCGPCRLKHPLWVKLYGKYNTKDFEIISISLDNNKSQWLNAIKKDKLTWTNTSDLKGWKNKIAIKYGISSVPYTILLNENYEVITTEISYGVMEAFLKEL
jgi:thiol-disulfide isomerase/thioredoxin